ncbi:MAG: hypothetical protein IPP90_04330 [Gemmatimonadaceae bacterium]|nr:hypothetical protein [Gemmatimonadaceae bacterium]
MSAIRSALRALAPICLCVGLADAQTPDAATLAGLRWRSIGPVNMAGRITDVEAHPSQPKTFYVAGATGGIWKTVNAGTTFVPLWEKAPIASMGDLAIAPSNPKIIWAGTGEEDSRNSVAPGYGIYKSVDGGVTWQSMGLEKTQHIGRILVHPTNPDIVYVSALGALWATNPERGLYKTTDGGKTWTLSKFVSDRAGFVDLAMDPRDPNVLYAASWERIRKAHFLKSGGPGSALWKSTDGGASWKEIKGGGFPATTKGRISLAIAPSSPDMVYAMVEADSVRGAKPQRLLSGLYRSKDAGATWTWMSTVNNRPFYFSQIRVDPKNPERIYRMAVDFQFSDDGGYSWRASMLGNHEDYHAMWIDPNDPEHFIIGGDAGIFQTWDRGGTYDALNNMAMGQFYGVSFDFQAPYRVCGGLQDNGTSCGLSRRSNAPLQMTDWFAVNGADGLQTAQDALNADLVYYESQGGNIARRNVATGETVNIRARTVTREQFGTQIARIKGDGSKPLTPEQLKQIADLRVKMKTDMADPNVATRWNWNTPFILSRHDANVFYSGADKLFKSVKQGVDPFAISPDLSSRDEARIRITTGYDIDGNVAVDGTGGITRDATGAEENATIVTIGESPLKPGVLYVGTNDGKVWLTKNDGGTWEDLSARFPGIPPFTHVSKVEPSGSDSATVYVSFDNHRDNDFMPYVYVSTDFGKTFTSLAKGLMVGRPNSVYVVREDPVNPRLLYVGTELGVSASLDKGMTWFPLESNLPTVPVYDLQVHPRDLELIAGTHGRGIQILDVAPLQQMTGDVLAKPAHLFKPTVALQYGERPVGSEPRAQRMWRGERTPSGAVIAYRLSAPLSSAPRVTILNAAGDTVARLVGTNTAGLNQISWNMQATGTQMVPQGGGGGRGGGGGFGVQPTGPVNDPGFPAGFNARPAESRAAPDSTGSPSSQARLLAQASANPPAGGRGGGGGGGGFGGFGGARALPVETGDYRVVIDAGGQLMSQTLRVVRVAPDETSVLVPAKR